MTNQIRITVLWLCMILCMLLHFDYHVSELFYGVDIRRPDANGTTPLSVIYIRSLFHFLPLLYIALVLWLDARSVKICHLLLTILYTLANIFHLAGELKKGDDPSQMVLLSVAAFLSCLLVVAGRGWLAETNKQKQNSPKVAT